MSQPSTNASNALSPRSRPVLATDHNVSDATNGPAPSPVPAAPHRSEPTSLAQAAEQCGFDVYMRRRFDPMRRTLTLIESRGLTPEAVARMERVSVDDAAHRILADGCRTTPTEAPRDGADDNADDGADDGADAELLRAQGVRTLCCLPLFDDEGLTGTLAFGSHSESFTERQRQWLQSVAAMLTAEPELHVDGAVPPQGIEPTLGAMRRLAETLEQRVNRRTQELANYHSQLRHLLSELVLTEQRERRRIAGELHDHLAQLLVACKMKLGLVRSALIAQAGAPPGGGDADATGGVAPAASGASAPGNLIDEIDGFLNESLAYTRNLVAQISPVLLYEQGLLPALRWLAEAVMPRHGLAVVLDEQTDLADVQLDEDVRILLFQSVRELLFNVVKHARADAARVTVRRRAGGLEVLVDDDGVGFDVDQVRMTGGTGQQGFGLLSIRERMTLLGGRFELTAAAGAGTRAAVRMPLDAAPAPEPAPADTPTAATTATATTATATSAPARIVTGREHIHVLVVDDHAVVREGLMMMLGKEHGLVIVGEAPDGATAIDLAHRLRPHVVLMDVGLPGMDGIETTRQLTKACRGIKVVGLSMHEDESTAAAMRAAGAVDYLCKGCSPDLLIGTIRRAATGESQASTATT